MKLRKIKDWAKNRVDKWLRIEDLRSSLADQRRSINRLQKSLDEVNRQMDVVVDLDPYMMENSQLIVLSPFNGGTVRMTSVNFQDIRHVERFLFEQRKLLRRTYVEAPRAMEQFIREDMHRLGRESQND
jgi:hypothetical protein